MLDQPTVQHKLEAHPSADAESARRLVLAAVSMAIFMSAVNISIVATAMPTIVAELGGFHLFSWTFAAYLLAQAVTIPIYGRLADLYGRKRVILAGVSLFVLGSGLCGLAWDMVPLILFRGLQGAGAGAVIVSTQASVGWNERGMATSSIMFIRMIGSSVGASVFGAIVNFGIHRRLPKAGGVVNQLMQPAARKMLHPGELIRLTEAIASSVHVVYVIAGLVAVVSLFLALALPARLSPTRQAPFERV